MIADLYNIPIGTIEKLIPNFFGKEKHVLHYETLQLYLELQSVPKYLRLTLVFT